MNTRLLLMARYDSAPIIPVETVCKDFYPHLSPDKFLRKVSLGEIKVPIMRMDRRSQKSGKGIHLDHLADLVDAEKKAAEAEAQKLAG